MDDKQKANQRKANKKTITNTQLVIVTSSKLCLKFACDVITIHITIWHEVRVNCP